MAVVTMKQLLEAGVHFGHQTRRWNPKMKRFIFGERNGIYIIDLNQTLVRVNTAYSYVRDLVAGGGTVMFVGTKKQTQDPVSEFALACGMPYVNQRWLGGMLTNFQTVAGRVRKLAELESARDAGDFEAMPKKEALQHQRELEKLERNLGGIRRLERPPDAIFVIDTKKEHIAVTEANKLGMPIVAVVDTNCDPDVITYVIPGNDDAIRSGALMCRVLAEAVIEGRWVAEHQRKVAPPAPAPTPRGQLRRAGAGTTGTLDPSAGIAPEDPAAGAGEASANGGSASAPPPAATAPAPATATPAPATATEAAPAENAPTASVTAPESSATEVAPSETPAEEPPASPTVAPAEEG